MCTMLNLHSTTHAHPHDHKSKRNSTEFRYSELRAVTSHQDRPRQAVITPDLSLG